MPPVSFTDATSRDPKFASALSPDAGSDAHQAMSSIVSARHQIDHSCGLDERDAWVGYLMELGLPRPVSRQMNASLRFVLAQQSESDAAGSSIDRVAGQLKQAMPVGSEAHVTAGRTILQSLVPQCHHQPAGVCPGC